VGHDFPPSFSLPRLTFRAFLLLQFAEFGIVRSLFFCFPLFLPPRSHSLLPASWNRLTGDPIPKESTRPDGTSASQSRSRSFNLPLLFPLSSLLADFSRLFTCFTAIDTSPSASLKPSPERSTSELLLSKDETSSRLSSRQVIRG